MGKIYNKLVRDKIPEIIKADQGRAPKTRVLANEEFIVELLKKLKEEAKELAEVKDNKPELIKEIGDVYEVIDAIIEYYNLDREGIMKLKNERKQKRGGFKKKIFLESVN